MEEAREDGPQRPHGRDPDATPGRADRRTASTSAAARPALRGPRPATRVIAGLVSGLIVLLFLQALRDARLSAPGTAARGSVVVSLTEAPRRPAREARPPPGRTASTPARRAPAPSPPVHDAAPPRSSPDVDESPSADPVPSVPAAASAPLRLDARTLRIAGQAGEASVNRMARRSGQVLNAPRASAGERLADTVAEAGVPNCLDPDGLKRDPPALGPIGLGGVLALPFVAHAAITGKCKP